MIGIFDSGVGGLTILREIQGVLPEADIVYYGDTAHVPYGTRSAAEVTKLAATAVEILLGHHPDLIVIGCNTATVVALETLRTRYPQVPIVGVVPVVKTLAERTRTNKVAVCATAVTLASAMYKKLKVEYAAGVDFIELAQPDWVLFAEAADTTGPETKVSIMSAAKKIRSYGADMLALGSTHFPFLRPLLEAALPGVVIVDSGPAVARQVVTILAANKTMPTSNETGTVTYLCSGNPTAFSWVVSQLLGQSVTVANPS